MTSYRLFEVTCPKCGSQRKVPYQQWWAITKKITTTICFRCSRLKKGEVNSGSFKVGLRPWNEGKSGTYYFSDLARSHMGKWRKGIPRKPEVIEKMKGTFFKKGHGKTGWIRKKHHSTETKLKLRLSLLGRFTGKNSPSWIVDRSKLKKNNRRGDMAYKEWRKMVWQRDGFKCRINDESCKGRIEAHHILGWSQFLELRYQVNNGITLCHFHHPRRREDEKRLSPYFQELVSVSREQF